LTIEDLLQRIQTDTSAAIRFYQQHATIDLGLLRELAKDLTIPGVALFLASMPNTPSRILETLEHSGDTVVLRQLALNPNCLQRMVNSQDIPARIAAAQSRKLTPQQAQTLVKDPDVAVRVELAKNPTITASTQMKISQDPVPFVRMTLLENRKLEEEFQIGLGDDIDTIVHLAALLVPKLSDASKNIWVKESEELAQLALSRRNDLTPEHVALLAKSQHPSVMLSLLAHQQLPEVSLEGFAQRGDEPTALALLKRNDLSPALQKAIWTTHSEKEAVRMAFAAHPALCDEVGIPLAKQGNTPIRQALAENLSENLPQTRLILAQQGDNALLKILLANPKCHSNDILDTIIIRGDTVVHCHIAARQLDCCGVSDQARKLLLQSPMPAVQALAKSTSEE